MHLDMKCHLVSTGAICHRHGVLSNPGPYACEPAPCNLGEVIIIQYSHHSIENPNGSLECEDKVLAHGDTCLAVCREGYCF